MNNTIRFPPGFGWSDVISAGNVGVVVDLDAVMKIAIREEDQHFIDVEKRIYERLANGHERVLRYYGPFFDGFLMERASHGSLRQYYAENGVPYANKGGQPRALQLRWIQQVVESIVYLHSKEILHADISCNNFFLDDNFDLKVGDFAGSSIDGSRSLVAYDVSHDHPALTSVSVESELFALGSVLYEIITGFPPYKGLSHTEIKDAYRHEHFPNLTSLGGFGDVITRCWRREYTSANEILLDVKAQGTVSYDHHPYHETDDSTASEAEKGALSNISRLLAVSGLSSTTLSCKQYLSILLLFAPTLPFIFRRWWLREGY
ncbi:MAG: hypothetical protein M1837_000476 [Sclerophora amabilis]|nr:MAG: hypothetical protein M1837_000476 [Sclerophora amabilis]